MQLKTIALCLALGGGLAACGDSATEQVGIGAAAGAGAAYVLDGSIFTGVALGAVGNVLYCEANPGRC